MIEDNLDTNLQQPWYQSLKLIHKISVLQRIIYCWERFGCNKLLEPVLLEPQMVVALQHYFTCIETQHNLDFWKTMNFKTLCRLIYATEKLNIAHLRHGCTELYRRLQGWSSAPLDATKIPIAGNLISTIVLWFEPSHFLG